MQSSKIKNWYSARVMPVGLLFADYYFYLMGIIENQEIRKDFKKENDSFPNNLPS